MPSANSSAGNSLGRFNGRAQHDDVCAARVLQLLGKLRGRNLYHPDVPAEPAAGNHAGIGDEHAAFHDGGLILVHGILVHGDERVHFRVKGIEYLVIIDAQVTTGRSAAHFRSVGGHPGKLLARLHGHIGEKQAGGENALARRNRNR